MNVVSNIARREMRRDLNKWCLKFEICNGRFGDRMFFTRSEKLGCSSQGRKSWDVLPTGCRVVRSH